MTGILSEALLYEEIFISQMFNFKTLPLYKSYKESISWYVSNNNAVMEFNGKHYVNKLTGGANSGVSQWLIVKYYQLTISGASLWWKSNNKVFEKLLKRDQNVS